MRKNRFRTAVLTGAASLLFAGGAVAATSNFHMMKVDLPDGSIAKIEYAGNVAPKVEIQPVDARDVAFVDPFGASMFPTMVDFDRISAMMQQQTRAMMHQVAQMQRNVASSAAPGQVLVSGKMPAGSSFHYTYVSSMNGKNVCSQSVEWSSDGSGKAPHVIRTSSGNCGAVKQGEGDKPVPVSAPKQATPVRGNMT